MSETALLWLAIFGMGAITYAIRLVLIALQGKLALPALFQRGLRYVPQAVLSAIIFPELFRPEGALDLSLGNVRLMAGLLAILVAWRTRHVLWTIAAGMAALWLLGAVLP